MQKRHLGQRHLGLIISQIMEKIVQIMVSKNKQYESFAEKNVNGSSFD